MNEPCNRCHRPLSDSGICVESCEITKCYEQIAKNQQIKLDEALARIKVLETEINDTREFIKEMGQQEFETITRLVKTNNRMYEALTLIAVSIRPDGTYNRDRKACQELAKEVLSIM